MCGYDGQYVVRHALGPGCAIRAAARRRAGADHSGRATPAAGAAALPAAAHQLSSFASEVTRVAREVGTEGELGGQ
ncbi:hypothetical protein ABZY03_32810, partial [Streptomyces klenkii]|uniref:hypothetical protein n=1 Tax=Streptomyces klenkii TaxID=1420899 RepID=UPI0033A53256